MRRFLDLATAVALVSLITLSASPSGADDEKIVHAFCRSRHDGADVANGLVNANGILYGTTVYGGGNSRCDGGCGTIFSIDPASGTETVLYSFGGADNDGIYPGSGVIDVDGTLYGVTGKGGSGASGTVYSFNLVSGVETVLHSFTGQDGDDPKAALAGAHGLLFGTTASGGRHGFGTVFSLDPGTGMETVLHSFSPDRGDGAGPEGALINIDGALVGTTSGSGAHEQGTIFLVHAAAKHEKVLYSFGVGGDASTPDAGLLDINGTFFGTTAAGGAYGYGAVFSFDPASRSEIVLHSFKENSTDGYRAIGGLIGRNGTLYGTTKYGGSTQCGGFGCGVVFSIDPASGAEAILHAFATNGVDGSYPTANLLDVNGTLYGTTSAGGGCNGGTVFSLTP